MADEVEKHLLAGVDERGRGFTRPVAIESREGAVHAAFRYETLMLESEAADPPAAVAAMIRLLQERGYSQLRTRRIFQEGDYLGSREEWIEHADPGGRASGPGIIRRLWKRLTRRSSEGV